MIEPIQFIPIASVLCLGIFVQSAAGFAAGLVAIPALMWLGNPIPEAQTALLIATIPQNLWGLWTFRGSVELSTVAWPGLTRIAFVPIGLAGLQMLETYSFETLRQIVGGAVLIATITIILFHPTPKAKLHPIWACFVFPLSGFLQGFVGMGGPPIVFWVHAHDWDTRRSRAFLFSVFMISLFPALGFLYARFGVRIVEPALMAIATTPLLLLSSFVGLKVGTWLGRDRLRTVTLGLLLVIGLSGLVA
ncbi:Sulfite exporter TauE/SafE [Novipirellula aureliae]|uniref:Probable membrane transporter protein n=1 Tax=Novipirellula aureliae TaxID=2527966 RepID=A0A5C6DIS0_9BACT|nr:sulfite exporter TauE/SafE family protein [Novipirellula aureliae]TWU36608.1 Sulfite exporter TauE/SafE [Novipirellula aureliae]